MFFPISGADISPIYLVIVGFLVGILGGFFGVGGSFIAGPALRLVGLDWNFAVGTDLAHIVGKSVVAAKRHRALGNVDLRLGSIMAIGTIAMIDPRRRSTFPKARCLLAATTDFPTMCARSVPTAKFQSKPTRRRAGPAMKLPPTPKNPPRIPTRNPTMTR